MSAEAPPPGNGDEGSAFPDHFSDRSAAYARHRPRYPPPLADFLAGIVPRPRRAWDAGCGSGQLSVLLAERFERVIATDASAPQIGRAPAHPRVRFRVAHSSRSGLGPASVDLAVAAQAAHWFPLGGYYAEVTRVVRPGGAVALVGYATASMAPPVGPVLGRFYAEVLGPYWPPARRHVEEGYRSLPFPFREIPAPAIGMSARWTLAQLAGYVGTWSAVRILEREEGEGPVRAFREELARAWGPAGTLRTIRWPLSVRAGYV